MHTELDVIIPVLDGGERFADCLEAVQSQLRADWKLIVVDNGSLDGSAERAVRAGAVVVREEVRSSYAARNRGLQEVTAPVVAFTDADCIPGESWLSAGLARLQEGADVCAGRVVQEGATTAAGRHDTLYLDQEAYVRAGAAATANLFVKALLFSDLGPFDARLRSGGDFEFCRRAVAAGAVLVYEPAATVRHPARNSLAGVIKKAYRIGRGHGEIAGSEGRSMVPLVRPSRLVPSRELRGSADWPVVAVDTAVRVAAMSGRVAGYATRRSTYRGRPAGESRRR